MPLQHGVGPRNSRWKSHHMHPGPSSEETIELDLISTSFENHGSRGIQPPVHPWHCFELSMGSQFHFPSFRGSESHIQPGNQIEGLHPREVRETAELTGKTPPQTYNNGAPWLEGKEEASSVSLTWGLTGVRKSYWDPSGDLLWYPQPASWSESGASQKHRKPHSRSYWHWVGSRRQYSLIHQWRWRDQPWTLLQSPCNQSKLRMKRTTCNPKENDAQRELNTPLTIANTQRENPYPTQRASKTAEAPSQLVLEEVRPVHLEEARKEHSQQAPATFWLLTDHTAKESPPYDYPDKECLFVLPSTSIPSDSLL